MKRKFNDAFPRRQKPDLHITIPDSLPCSNCFKRVTFYRECKPPFVFCSSLCLEMLIMEYFLSFRDEKFD